MHRLPEHSEAVDYVRENLRIRKLNGAHYKRSLQKGWLIYLHQPSQLVDQVLLYHDGGIIVASNLVKFPKLHLFQQLKLNRCDRTHGYAF